MKNRWIFRILALVMALTLAVPTLAMAEEEIVMAGMVDLPLEEAAEYTDDLPVEEEAELPVEAPVELPGMEVVEGASYDASSETLMAAAGGAPSAVSIDTTQGLDFYLGMGPVQLNAVLSPAGTTAGMKWKSSKTKVAKVNANGVMTPLTPGRTKITVTTSNKKKASVKVTIHRNIIDNINPKPTKAQIRTFSTWGMGPKSVERTANGSYVCKFYMINNLGTSTFIKNLGLQLYVGGTLVAEKTWSKVKVVCGSGKCKVFKVTFTPRDLRVTDPLLLPRYGKESLDFVLTTRPIMYYRYTIYRSSSSRKRSRKRSSTKAVEVGKTDKQ